MLRLKPTQVLNFILFTVRFLTERGKYKGALTRKWWNWQTHHLPASL
jgi:hypothetical protein